MGLLTHEETTAHRHRQGRVRWSRGRLCVERSDIEGAPNRGDEYELRRDVAPPADLMEKIGGAREIHIEIIAHSSVRADEQLLVIILKR